MFRASVDMGEREDWFTAVDGLVPSLGFAGAVFDHKNFNHAYITAHVAYKIASSEWGYSLGFERPLFRPVPLYVGGELYDLTATDDHWQVSGRRPAWPRSSSANSMRDYYRRHGVQLHAAVRPASRLEVQFAWRGERHDAARHRERFQHLEWRRRVPAERRRRRRQAERSGRSERCFDSVGFQDDSLAATYRQHLMNRPFGRTLTTPQEARRSPVWRLRSGTREVSTPEGTRFRLRLPAATSFTAALLLPLSGHEEVRARVPSAAGRVASCRRSGSSRSGAFGTVHGYGFKEAVGDGMVLFNVEYALGKLDGPPHRAVFRRRPRLAARRRHFVAARGRVRPWPDTRSPRSTSDTSWMTFPARSRRSCAWATPSSRR